MRFQRRTHLKLPEYWACMSDDELRQLQIRHIDQIEMQTLTPRAQMQRMTSATSASGGGLQLVSTTDYCHLLKSWKNDSAAKTN